MDVSHRSTEQARIAVPGSIILGSLPDVHDEALPIKTDSGYASYPLEVGLEIPGRLGESRDCTSCSAVPQAPPGSVHSLVFSGPAHLVATGAFHNGIRRGSLTWGVPTPSERHQFYGLVSYSMDHPS
ncbi:Hypothetical predicted protein [Marmota monax]|uniref:Uncharacterized protein n=1 Tax=Marmota monax TaxID=9995 RepID=A0A5E4AZ72_MARMO|nr:Hypothetical predicted protein [Marmota monax]